MTRTVDYDRLASSAPINRQAALTRDGRGPDFGLEAMELENHWSAPPPPERAPPRDLPRLEGREFGAGMRVVRYHGKRSNGARWLVRCACGDYELRATQAIQTAQADHACQKCNHTRHLRWASDPNRTADTRAKGLQPAFRFKLTLAEMQTLRRLASAAGETSIAQRLTDRLSGVTSDSSEVGA